MNKQTLRHPFEYEQFIDWIALPKDLREPKTQKELSKKFGVGEDTLSEWKTRDGFWDEVSKRRKTWGQERTPEVIHAFYKRILVTGDPASVKLWLQYFEGFGDEKEEGKGRFGNLLEDISDVELDAMLASAEAFFKKKPKVPKAESVQQ